MSVFLTNPIILGLSVIAVICAVSSVFVGNKNINAVLHIIKFLLVIANIVYALLLGAELADVLVYVLLFVLLGILEFLPYKENRTSIEDKNDKGQPGIKEDGNVTSERQEREDK